MRRSISGEPEGRTAIASEARVYKRRHGLSVASNTQPQKWPPRNSGKAAMDAGSNGITSVNSVENLSTRLPNRTDTDRLADADQRCRERFRKAGLRPTYQRLQLGKLLFANGDRHITAEMLFSEALNVGIRVSLSTVYNTLNQFTRAGLSRRVGLDASRAFYDTDASVHPHFYLPDEGVLIDVPDPDIVLGSMPQILAGHELSRVDIIIHLRRQQVTRVQG